MSWPRTVLLLAACRATEAQPPRTEIAVEIEAARWPEGDALFRGNPRWLGADGAYSVELSPQRALWLFGDTFVATSDNHVRSEARMVRNTLGLQSGDQPMQMVWADGPDAVVPDEGDRWHWPLHGVTVDGALTLFFLVEAPTDTGLGFDAVGWTARRVADPSGDPASWTLSTLATPATPGLAVGTAVLATETHILAYAVEEPGDHDVFLLRWNRAAFVAGNLAAPAWYTAAGWDPDGPGDAVFGEAQTELSVSHLPALELYVAVYTLGFGATTIGIRTAAAPEGPWSDVRSVFRPPESDRSDTLVYAAKAHPWLDAPGGRLAVTYAANAKEFGVLVEDDALYWPRLVTLDLRPQ